MSEPIDVAALVMNTDGVKKGADEVKQAMQDTEQHVRRAAQAFEESSVGLSKYTESIHHVIEAAKAYVAYDVFREAFEKIKDATMEAEQAQLKLAAVYQATGGIVGRTMADLQEQAHAMAEVTLFDPNQIKEAEAALLTFSKVRGDAFDKTLTIAAGMASLFGGDLTSATRMLGRALEDPVRGLFMLQHYGVALTASEREHIVVLEQLGQQLEAQKYLLDILYPTYGKVAQELHSGLGGTLSDLKKSFSDLYEEIGTTGAFQEFLNGFRGLKQTLDEIVVDIKTIRGEDLGPAAQEDKITALTAQLAELQRRRDAMANLPGHPTLFGVGVMPEDIHVLDAQIAAVKQQRAAEQQLVDTRAKTQAQDRDRIQNVSDLRAQLDHLGEIQADADEKHRAQLKAEYEALRTIGRQYEENAFRLTHTREEFDRFQIARAQHPDVTPKVVEQADVDRERAWATAMEERNAGLEGGQAAMKAEYEALKSLAQGYEDAAQKVTLTAAAYEKWKIAQTSVHWRTPDSLQQSDVDRMREWAAAMREAASAAAQYQAANDQRAAVEMGIGANEARAGMRLELGGGYPSAEDKLRRDNENMMREVTRSIQAQQLHLDMAKYNAATPFEQMDMVRRAQEDATQYETIWKEALRNVQDDFAQLFQNIMSGEDNTLRKFVKDVAEALEKIAAQIAAAEIENKIGHLLSHVSWLYSLFHPGGPATSGGYNDIADASIAHGGGVVGADAFGARTVPSLAFAGAPRLHRGLAADEFPAILQRGETVLTPGQMRAVAAGGGQRPIVVQNEHHWHIAAMDSASFGDMLVTHQPVIEGIMADSITRSRRLASVLQRPR